MATPIQEDMTPRGRRHFNESEVAYANLLEKPLFSGRRHFGSSGSGEDADSSPSAAKRYNAALLADMKAAGGNGLPRSAGGSGKRIEDLEFLNAGSGHSAWKPVTKGGFIPQPPPLKHPPGTLPGGNAVSDAAPLDPKQKQEQMIERLTKPLHRVMPKEKTREVVKIKDSKVVESMESYLRVHQTKAENRIAKRNAEEAALCKSPRKKLNQEEIDIQLKRLITESLDKKKGNLAAYRRKEEKERLQHKTLASPRLTKSQQAAVAQRLCNESVEHQRGTIASAAEKYLGGSRRNSPRTVYSR